MTSPVRQSRVELKARGGIDLPPVLGALGKEISFFWSEVVHRERQEKLEMVQYLPAALYTMSGVGETVPFEKREKALSSFREKIEGKIRQTEYSTQARRNKLERRIKKLKEKKAQLDRLEAMSNDDFYENWLDGKV